MCCTYIGVVQSCYYIYLTAMIEELVLSKTLTIVTYFYFSFDCCCTVYFEKNRFSGKTSYRKNAPDAVVRSTILCCPRQHRLVMSKVLALSMIG